jgi:hypothetical protein
VSRRDPKQERRFHEPLVAGESSRETRGCRHRSPDSCSKHSMASVCAFVRADGICLSPPGSWPKQFEKLLRLENHGVDDK